MVKELIQISKYAGMREDLVQTGGGNSSVKLGPGCMLIKGMGVQMADMRSGTGYSVVDQRVFQTFFSQYQGESVTAEQGESLQAKAYLAGSRPAIETFFHALTGRVTLHTHPVLVNVLTARTGGMEILKELFPDALTVGYASPGLALGVAFFEQMRQCGLDSTFKGIAFIKNHGLLVSGDSTEFVMGQTEAVLDKIAAYLHYDNRANKHVTELYGWLAEVCDMEDNLVYRARNADIQSAWDALAENKHTFCPDSVVFCGKALLVLDHGSEAEQIKTYIHRFGVPSVILYDHQTYLVASSMKKAKEMESVVSFSAETAALNRGHTVDLLPEEEVNFLLDWEVEKFRKNM